MKLEELLPDFNPEVLDLRVASGWFAELRPWTAPPQDNEADLPAKGESR
jgi:hypothetical protein